MKLDILVFAAHPDDAELGCGGTIALEISKGKKVGIVDLTAGEMGTRGTPEIRLQEAENAAKILGISARENLHFRDAFFTDDEDHQKQIVSMIRKYQPEIVLTNAIEDRHPDHAKASKLVAKSCFLAGLKRLETQENGTLQEAWRPTNIYFFVQSNYISPDFVVDISDFWDIKIESVLAYKTQFYDPLQAGKDETFISSPQFLKLVESRGIEYGSAIRVKYGEGFTTDKQLGIKDLFDLI